MLSRKQVADVCIPGNGAISCRYLERDLASRHTLPEYFCKKKSPDKKIYDDYVAEHLNNCTKRGLDPLQEGVAIGDNCEGYLPFKSKLQGYDVE